MVVRPACPVTSPASFQSPVSYLYRLQDGCQTLPPIHLSTLPLFHARPAHYSLTFLGVFYMYCDSPLLRNPIITEYVDGRLAGLVRACLLLVEAGRPPPF